MRRPAQRAEITWTEIPPTALETILSTGQDRPLSAAAWPPWRRTTSDWSGWFSYVGGPLATSTGTLSTGTIVGYVDAERLDVKPPHRRYYRYLYAEITDGRAFQSSPIKALEYDRRREERPSWLAPHVTPSTSTG